MAPASAAATTAAIATATPATAYASSATALRAAAHALSAASTATAEGPGFTEAAAAKASLVGSSVKSTAVADDRGVNLYRLLVAETAALGHRKVRARAISAAVHARAASLYIGHARRRRRGRRH